MKKLHFVLVKAVIDNLQEIFINEKYADKVVALSLRGNTKFGSRDRKFIASATYDIVRWWRLLFEDYTDNKIPSEGMLYKVFYTYLVWKEIAIPEWKEFEGLDLEEIKARLANVSDYKTLESIPDWLDDLASSQLGEEVWKEEIASMNKEAELIIRCNEKNISTENLIKEFEKLEIPAEEISDHAGAIWVKKKQKITASPLYSKGFFEVHDLGSQFIAPFLEVAPGMKVIDACAGAGGKSLHLAGLMKHKGKIVSMDIIPKKLKEVELRAKRNGVKIIETIVIKGENTLNDFKESADRLLLDVPCSGLGVLKRNPDAKWKLTPAFINEIKDTQAYILQSYTKMLKPGGLAVYATCSILPDENENQVKKFLKKNPKFTLIREKRVSPTNPLSDGYYMALLKKS
jgi:16S rRNA (cytosine967-C5)-methyltransferase